MAYRLQQLAVGNFILEFSSSSSGSTALDETLLKVTEKIRTDEFGQHHVLSVTGFKKTQWGFTEADKTISTQDDALKFSPMSHDEAMAWIERNELPAKFASALQSAKESVAKAEMRCERLNMLFGAAPAAIEGATA